MFAEPALRRDGVEDLQDLGPQETFRGDGEAASLAIEGVEEGAHLAQGPIHYSANGAKRVILGDAVLQALEHDEALLLLLISPHEPLLFP